jgi:subtilisin family serine protease
MHFPLAAALLLATVAGPTPWEVDSSHPPDSRPWTAKVSRQLLDAGARPDERVVCLLTWREPSTEPVVPLAPLRASWIARSGAELERDYRDSGLTVVRRFKHFPVMKVALPAGAIAAVASDPRVEALSVIRSVRALDSEGASLMNVPAVIAQGYNGTGIGVAVLDTGVDYTHSELSPGGTDPSAKTIKLYDAVDSDNDPMDEEGHGTAVAGIVAGKVYGVAKAARIVAVRVLDENGEGDSDQLLVGLDQVADTIAAGNPYNVKAINLSLGGYADDWPPASGACDDLDPATAAALATLADAGVLTFAASGNGGCTEGVAWPACLSDAVAVGAVYDEKICTQQLPGFCADYTASWSEGQCTPSGCSDTTEKDRIACYTDSGDKLELFAPSFAAETAKLGGGKLEDFAGTSAAAPYAAGVAALLTHAVPGRTASALRAALRDTGRPRNDARNGVTRNRIDAQAALAALRASCTAPATPTGLGASQQAVCQNEAFTLSWGAISGVASYAVQLAANAAFTGATEKSVTMTSTTLSWNGASAGTLFARVRAVSPCGSSSEWSANLTLAYEGQCTTPSYAHTYYLSGVAHTPGVAPAYWLTDLSVLNVSGSQTELRLAFYGNGTPPTPVGRTLATRQQSTWRDVLPTLFGVSGEDVGAIVVESTQPVTVQARTYSRLGDSGGERSYGQSYEALEVGQALTASRLGYLPSLRSDGAFRTNVEFVNVAAVAATVEVRFYDNAGAPVGTRTLAVSPSRRSALTAALPGGVTAAWAEVTVTPADARVIGFASVVDGNSTDPTTVPMTVR